MYVKRLRLQNVRGFQDLDFDFERPDGSYAGWTVFVGGNSSGKSTLLKSLALAILGPDAGRQLMGPTQGWIHQGAKSGEAQVDLVADELDSFRGAGKTRKELDATVVWELEQEGDEVPVFRSKAWARRNSTLAERGPWSRNAAGWFSCGYGPMRRLSEGSLETTNRFAETKSSESRFMTLFREDAALSKSEAWLRRMHSRNLESPGNGASEILNGVQALLNDGLLPQGIKVSKITVDKVFVTDGRGIELPMSDISDGCRSVYATILNIVQGLSEVYGNRIFGQADSGKTIVDKPGVVIIDEVEAHLHPTWQREIPYWLKAHFPRIQFLVSTHSPLVAQAADPNGLFLLPVQNDYSSRPRRATQEQWERIRWGTAHKTVLGVAFGLDSTRTRWAEQRIARWQLLNAKKSAGAVLTEPELQEHQELQERLEQVFDNSSGSVE